MHRLTQIAFIEELGRYNLGVWYLVEKDRSATESNAPLTIKILAILEPGFVLTIPFPVGKIPPLSRFL